MRIYNLRVHENQTKPNKSIHTFWCKVLGKKVIRERARKKVIEKVTGKTSDQNIDFYTIYSFIYVFTYLSIVIVTAYVLLNLQLYFVS